MQSIVDGETAGSIARGKNGPTAHDSDPPGLSAVRYVRVSVPYGISRYGWSIVPALLHRPEVRQPRPHDRFPERLDILKGAQPALWALLVVCGE